jgi:hypothetical protein
VRRKLEDDRDRIAHWRLNAENLEEAKKLNSVSGEFLDSLMMADSEHAHNAQLVYRDVAQLVRMIETGQSSASNLVRLFCCRAAYAHQLVRSHK